MIHIRPQGKMIDTDARSIYLTSTDVDLISSSVTFFSKSTNGPKSNAHNMFYYENIKLWEVDAQVLKQKGLEGLLPLCR
jgi:hypothetical protein